MTPYAKSLLEAVLDPEELYSLDIHLELKAALDAELGDSESTE